METKLKAFIIFAIAILHLNVDAHDQPAAPAAGGTTFDITKYGAAPGSGTTPGKDIAEALCNAWKDAINSPTPATVVIPAGTWFLSQVKLTGPAKAPITLCIQGTVQACSSLNPLPNPEAEWLTIMYVCGLTITGGGVLNGMGAAAWKANDCSKNADCKKLKIFPMNLCMAFINNTLIEDITTKDSKNFHVNLISSNNVTFQRFHVCAPEESINTDGIHIGRSKNINIFDTTVATGDDCISIGDDTCELTIRNVTCGPGHGVSIGSLGKYENEKDVQGISVKNCTFTNTQNGVRIKTWPSGPSSLCVSNIDFEDLIMNNVSNPIIIDQEYCPYNLCDKSKASTIQINNVTVKNVKGTAYTCDAVILACSTSKPCTNVNIGDVDLGFSGKVGPITTKCSNVKPIFTGKQNPPICAAGDGGAKPA